MPRVCRYTQVNAPHATPVHAATERSPMPAPAPTPPNLLVVGDDPPPLPALLAGRAEVVAADPARLAAQLRAADAVYVWDFTSDALRDAWPAADPPAWVHTASAGVDRLLFPALVESATVVTNSRGVFEQPLAEYTAGLVLAMAKDFPGTWELQRQRRWQHRATMRVQGSRAVVAGGGPIGRAIAQTLRALGIGTELVGRTAREGVHGADELLDLLPQADWVVCAAPLTEATRGMFDARAFAAMRPGARFVNVARGPLVVEEDLRTALLTHRIAGAALDVFAQEPLPPGHPLWDTPGLLVSPHMSSDTFGWREELAEVFLANFDRWTSGCELRNIVDKKLGYVPVEGPV
jgi:phosphoglycerate dehydrogenase-like enzyme